MWKYRTTWQQTVPEAKIVTAQCPIFVTGIDTDEGAMIRVGDYQGMRFSGLRGTSA